MQRLLKQFDLASYSGLSQAQCASEQHSAVDKNAAGNKKTAKKKNSKQTEVGA